MSAKSKAFGKDKVSGRDQVRQRSILAEADSSREPISEENNGFAVEDFVDYVKKDTTFYIGFKHLRDYSHNYESELNVFNKKGKVIGTLI